MRRLLIVSNRLPINIKKNGDDSNWSFQVSSGGLVSALQGLQKSTSFIWIGWPGTLSICISNKHCLNFANEFRTPSRRRAA